MGPGYRTVRAAASAILTAAAVGAGGMTGMTAVLAVDPPATVSVTGTLVDGAGTALAGVHLVITEELPPDGGFAAFQATTGADGSFAADVYPWGTADAPATLKIAAPADEEIELLGEDCSRTWSVAVDSSQQVALADAAPDPLALVATTTLLGEVCGTIATAPPVDSGTSGAGPGGTAVLTPPPTDMPAAPAAPSGDRLGLALLLGFAIGLAVVIALLTPRPGARSRD